MHRVPERVAAGEAALRERGWLAQMPPAFQDAILGIGIWKSAQPGDTFIHAGDADGGLLAIAAGTAAVSMEAGHPDTRFVHLVHAGFWAGFRPLLGGSRNISLEAQTPTLWLLVPKQATERLLHEQPAFWRHIAHLVNSAYEISVSVMVDLTRQNGQTRVAGTLLRIAGCRFENPRPGDDTEIRVPQSEIAAASVMSRNTLGTYLADLASMGLIEIGYRSIRIKDPGGLRALMDLEE
ncbi:MAG: Crp/Fnr family transcriptional regulator [Polymorphobacter sp.]|uniref:Crp/Fnr family transcriptional regulator n=1 Tax=Polymorphobacter sp. TaxID=1909290 RepID=UPI003A837C13